MDWSRSDHTPQPRREPPAPKLDAILFRLVGQSGQPIRGGAYFVATGIELRIGYENDPDAPFETRLFRPDEDEAIAELAAEWRSRFDALGGFHDLAILQ